MLDLSLMNSSAEGEYETRRNKQKLDTLQVFFVFVKSTIGLAIFGYHEVYQKSGIWLGLFISAVFIYTVVHGVMRTVTFAQEAEARLEQEGLRYRVDSYFELIEVSLNQKHPRLARLLGPATFYLVFFSTVAYTLSSVLALAKTLSDMLGWSELAIKLAIFAVAAVCLLLMLEPEKLVYLSYVLTILVASLVLLSSFYAVQRLRSHGVSSKVVSFRWRESSLSCGYVITSFEVINYVLNIRRLMKDREQFPAVGYSSLYFCALLYVVPSLLMYLGFEGSADPKLEDLYYRTFTAIAFMKLLNELMGANFLYGLTSMTIYNMEMLEKIRLLKPFIRDKDGGLRSANVLAVRVFFVALVVLLSHFVRDLRLVYSLTGVFLNSFIGLIIPGLIGVLRSAADRQKDALSMRLSDLLCLVAGSLAILLFFFDLAIGKD